MAGTQAAQTGGKTQRWMNVYGTTTELFIANHWLRTGNFFICAVFLTSGYNKRDFAATAGDLLFRSASDIALEMSRRIMHNKLLYISSFYVLYKSFIWL